MRKWINRLVTMYLALCWAAILVLGGVMYYRYSLSSTPPDPAASAAPTLNNSVLLSLLDGQLSGEGTQKVAATLTGQQVSELLAQVDLPFAQGLSVDLLGNDQAMIEFQLNMTAAELSAVFPQFGQLADLIAVGKGTPVSIQARIEYQGDNQFAIAIEALHCAGITVPTTFLANTDESVTALVNASLSQLDGLDLTKLEIHEDELVVEGTLPQSIRIENQ